MEISTKEEGLAKRERDSAPDMCFGPRNKSRSNEPASKGNPPPTNAVCSSPLKSLSFSFVYAAKFFVNSFLTLSSYQLNLDTQ